LAVTRPLHLVITDSGLGGLTICAAVELAVRRHALRAPLRITYVNAWPDEGHGYNDLPDIAARAAAFDRVLARIHAMAPDHVLIACNTLSIVYRHTAHSRQPTVPVHGIIDAGVDHFERALREHPDSALVMIGTRTTIESGVHADALVGRGLAAHRLAGASCHGLATAIEQAPFGEATDALIETCCMGAAEAAPSGDPLFVGLCCTHYGLVGTRIASTLARQARRAVVALDPNVRLVRDVVATFAPDQGSPAGEVTPATVQVISKVTVPESKRRNIGRILHEVSPGTATALREYSHVPDLF
jgi:glutamate racemase